MKNAEKILSRSENLPPAMKEWIAVFVDFAKRLNPLRSEPDPLADLRRDLATMNRYGMKEKAAEIEAKIKAAPVTVSGKLDILTMLATAAETVPSDNLSVEENTKRLAAMGKEKAEAEAASLAPIFAARKETARLFAAISAAGTDLNVLLAKGMAAHINHVSDKPLVAAGIRGKHRQEKPKAAPKVILEKKEKTA